MAGFDDLSGITIDGKDLGEELAKGDAHNIAETLAKQKHYLKKGSKVKHMEHTEPNGEVKRETQHNLNIINYKANVEKCKTNYQRAIVLLVTGREISSDDLKRQFQSSESAAILKKIYDSRLGAYMERDDTSKLYTYQCTEEGCNLTPDEAYSVYKTPPLITDKEVEREGLQIPDAPGPVIKIPKRLIETAASSSQDINVNVTVTFKIKWGD